MPTPPKNWRIFVECVDCGAGGEVAPSSGVSWSIEIVDGARVVVVILPQVCPECGNRDLKVVEGSDG